MLPRLPLLEACRRHFLPSVVCPGDQPSCNGSILLHLAQRAPGIARESATRSYADDERKNQEPEIPPAHDDALVHTPVKHTRKNLRIDGSTTPQVQAAVGAMFLPTLVDQSIRKELAGKDPCI
jgi:hypothetical protein